MTDAIFPRDYNFLGRDAKRALKIGLANAQWYQAPIVHPRLKALQLSPNHSLLNRI